MPLDEQYPEVVETETPGGEQAVETPSEVPQEGAQAPVVEKKPVWNGEEYVYQYKGQKIVPKSKEHLLALAQKGHGFNTEYDKLKQERQQFESTRSQYEKYSKLDKLFQEHPELQNQINNVVNEYRQNGGKVSANGQPDPVTAEARQILEQTRGLYEQLTKAQADKQLEEEINRLKTTYPGDWTTDDGEGTLEKKVLNHALKGNFPSLEAAYRDFMWDSVQTTAKAEALRQSKEKQQNDFRAGKVALGGKAAPTPVSKDVTKMSYNEIANAVGKGELV